MNKKISYTLIIQFDNGVSFSESVDMPEFPYDYDVSRDQNFEVITTEKEKFIESEKNRIVLKYIRQIMKLDYKYKIYLVVKRNLPDEETIFDR